jgi:methylenetetrahydrofolate reductase (NADPH)
MSFIQKLRNGEPTLSCEFFPPKNSGEWSTLYQTMGRIARLGPDFVSVTYGAGGSTREKTVDLVRRIEGELGIEAVAHLTCVGHSKSEIEQILKSLKANNVNAIMALRGDPPKGALKFEAHKEGFSHACDLISFANQDPDLTIGCAFYPEKHPEALSLDSDIKYLKLKQDCGADFAASQIFFDNDSFYRFRDQAQKAGVTLPLVAGILPATSRSQVSRIGTMCGTIIPSKLQAIVDNASEGDSIKDAGVEFAVEQCIDLLANGVVGIHLYTFNLSNSSVKVISALRSKGFFPLSESDSAAEG